MFLSQIILGIGISSLIPYSIKNLTNDKDSFSSNVPFQLIFYLSTSNTEKRNPLSKRFISREWWIAEDRNVSSAPKISRFSVIDCIIYSVMMGCQIIIAHSHGIKILSIPVLNILWLIKSERDLLLSTVTTILKLVNIKSFC